MTGTFSLLLLLPLYWGAKAFPEGPQTPLLLMEFRLPPVTGTNPVSRENRGDTRVSHQAIGQRPGNICSPLSKV